MKSRYAVLMLLGVVVAVAGCPKAPVQVAADEERTSNNKGNKAKSPAPAKSAGTTSPRPSGSPKPSGSPATGGAGGASPSPSPSASASASTTPTTTTTPSTAVTTTPGEDAPTAVTVLVKGMEFLPGRVTIKAGGKVTFINRDTASHSIKPDGNTAFTASEVLAPPAAGSMDGGVANITFATAGEVKYVCGIHATMKGTVVVVP